jgi:hypothetical protein
MKTLGKEITSKFFKNPKTGFQTLETAWKDWIRKGGKPTSSDILIYQLVRGKDWTKSFTLRSNNQEPIQRAEGFWLAWHFINVSLNPSSVFHGILVDDIREKLSTHTGNWTRMYEALSGNKTPYRSVEVAKQEGEEEKNKIIESIKDGFKKLQEEDRTPYSYVFVRDDIDWPFKAVQAAHACQHAGNEFEFPENTHLIMLRVRDESHLLEVKERFVDQMGYKGHLFYEPDYPKGHTSLCLEPVCGERREPFNEFQLAGKNDNAIGNFINKFRREKNVV